MTSRHLALAATCTYAALLGASLGYAAEEISVTTASKSMKISGEFRAEARYQDHGFKKLKDQSADKTTTVEVQTVKVKLSGKLDDKTEAKFRFNLYNAKSTPLDYGYLTHWCTDTFGFSAGKMKVMQGGWDSIDSSFKDHWTGAYMDSRPFDTNDPMIAMHMKMAGQINVQVLNDVTTKDKTGEWNDSAHPTVALGWLGDLGSVAPIVELGSYDNNKSRWIDVGMKTDLSGLKLRVDLRDQLIGRKGTGDDGKAKLEADKAQGATLLASYEIQDFGNPWIYFSNYDKKQYDVDVEGNLVTKDTDGKKFYKFTDNGRVMGAGLDFTSFGKNWTPYLALIVSTAKFIDPEISTDEVESKRQTQMRAGVLGEF